MCRVKHVVALLIFSVLSVSAIADAASWGSWIDNQKTHGYSFSTNNDFKYWDGKGKTDGVWKYDKGGACWAGDKKQQLGNLMIYVNTYQCCMNAQFLSNKLVLSEVWAKPFVGVEMCSDHVLNRTQALPDE